MTDTPGTSQSTPASTPMSDRDAFIWAVVVALVAAVCVVNHNKTVLADPDTMWHIAAGQLMWNTFAFPQIDTMSHTYAGRPWIAKEWLSQVILFGAHALGGWPGVQILSGLALSSCVGIIAYRLLKTCSWLLVAFLCWIAIVSLLFITIARPHLLALPIMALFIHMLLNASERDGTPPWLALPLLMVWANLHAAFTLGFIVAACLGLDAILRQDRREWLRLVGLWALFGLCCLAVVCIHPYGWQSLLINIEMATGNESIPLIGEWKPHPVFEDGGLRVLVPAVLLLTLLSAGWRAAGRILLGVFALYLTVRHQRFVMLLAVAAPMISARTAQDMVSALFERYNLFQGPDPLRDPKWRVPIMVGCLSAILASPFVMEKMQPPDTVAPVAALASVPPELRRQPVYNSYNFGGFLIINGIPTFVDGRTDQLFTDNFMARFFAYLKKGDDAAFLAFIENHKPRWAIVEIGQEEDRAFSGSPLWRETFADKHSKVFVRVDG